MQGGLTPRQLAVMTAVAGKEGLNQMEIARRTGIDRSTTTTDVVRRLIKKGWLHRWRSRVDTRAYVLRLTDAGRSKLRVAEGLVMRIDARVLGALPRERRGSFMVSLQGVIDALEGTEPGNTARSAPC